MFQKLFRSKNPDSPRYRLQKSKEISGKAIRYVSERTDETDCVIGRGGAISLRDGDLIVFSSSDVLFRSPAQEVQAWDLLSGDGVVLTGRDLEHGEKLRTITVYYVDFL